MKPCCSKCIPLGDRPDICPNRDSIVDDSLAETCEHYLNAEFYAKVMLPDDYPDREKAIESFANAVKR